MPRRAPVQARSRATVERILEAAAAVLAEKGWGGASTNAIARRAGVSPGSLYQYFADREAIVAALVDRLVADFEARITLALRRAGAVGPDASGALLITAVLDALDLDAPLLRAIADHIPPAEQAPRLAAVRSRLEDAVFAQQRAAGPGRADAELDGIAWLTVETAQHLAIRYVLDAPAMGRAAFAAALRRMLEAVPPPPA